MDRIGRFVSILILSVWSLQASYADPISSGFDIRNFQAFISANLDTCNLKIKISDTKYIAPANKVSPTSIASVPTNPTPTPHLSDIKIEKGEKGDVGDRGVQGIPGIKGESGEQGEKGDKGDQGGKGERGEKGEPGIEGLQGIPGEIGVVGPQGKTGEKGEQGLKGDKGEKGNQGEIGLQGISGAKGEPGEPGSKGDKGEQGLRGEKGANGIPGERGSEGISGPKGDRGEVGAKGDPGPQGFKGDSGEKGDRGFPGLQGDVGPAGKDCTRDDLPGPEEGTISLGDSAKPATSCAQLSSDGIYHINPSNPFTIDCVKGEMCLQKRDFEIDLDEEALHFDRKPFWWNLDFKELYKIQESQMAYLLSQSTSVRQTLKYHCYNTEVIPSANPSKALLLSLWSGQLVEKSPTRESPIYYEVVENTCDKAKDTWESANIKMETNFTNRLPIVDIYVQDIREETQQAALEVIELCFTYHKPESP